MHRLLILLALMSCRVPARPADDNASLAQRAVEAQRNGDFATAISVYQRLLKSGEDPTDLRNNLGIAYFQVRQYSNALQQFRIALAKEPDSLPANLFSGLSLMKLAQPRQALPFLQKAHLMRPQDADVLMPLAQASLVANKADQASDYYREATQFQPGNAEAWYGLGITERVLAEAELKPHASNPSGQARGKARALLRDSEQAVAKAVQLDPSSVHSHMIFGEALRIAERYQDAVHEYEAATQQGPTLAAAWAGLATAYSAAGDDTNALKAGRRALELDSTDAATNGLVAGTYLRQGDLSNAERYARRALELQPELSAGHVVLAKVYLARHASQDAAAELQAAAPDDDDGSIHYLLATTLRQLGKTQEAASAMQQYRQLHARVVAAAK